MKKLSETLKEMGIDFALPIEIKNSKGQLTYYENSDGFCSNHEYDSNGKQTYYEDSNGVLLKSEYDSDGNKTYCENSNGFWEKRECDSNGKQTYYESSDGRKEGTPRLSATCQGKVVEVDGVKYKLQTL